MVEQDGGVLLGKRQNEPARGGWFIPGGPVQKGESLEPAVQNIARAEIGSEIEILTQLGVYEYRYEVSEFEGVSKHYIPICYVVRPIESRVEPDTQHSELEIFEPPFSEFHQYVQAYLDDYSSWES